MKSRPGLFGVADNMIAEEKLRKIILAHREKRYASAYKKKMREMTRRKHEKV